MQFYIWLVRRRAIQDWYFLKTTKGGSQKIETLFYKKYIASHSYKLRYITLLQLFTFNKALLKCQETLI